MDFTPETCQKIEKMLILNSRYRGIVAIQGNYPQKCCHSAMVQKYTSTKTVGKTANGKRGTGLQESIMSRFFGNNRSNANIRKRGMQNFGQISFCYLSIMTDYRVVRNLIPSKVASIKQYSLQ